MIVRRRFQFCLDADSGGDSGGDGDSSGKSLSLSASERFQQQPETPNLPPPQCSVDPLYSFFKKALCLSPYDMIPYRSQISFSSSFVFFFGESSRVCLLYSSVDSLLKDIPFVTYSPITHIPEPIPSGCGYVQVSRDQMVGLAGSLLRSLLYYWHSIQWLS
jgi:hypothetical protein